MTERLESQELTQEDLEAWFEVIWRLKRPGQVLWTRSLMQDEWDAELMSEAQDIARFGGCAIELYGIPVRGWDPA